MLIAALAFQRGSLSQSGAVGAVLTGTLVFGSGGLSWGVLLVAFFVTSSALSHYKSRAKEPLADKFQKGHRRDLGQVLANGGWGAILAVAYVAFPQALLFVAFVGTMATVNADTWATELGVLSRSLPRMITTGQEVPVGTSGGVSTFGLVAALAGALLVGVLAFFLSALGGIFAGFSQALPNPFWLIPLGAVAGLLGSLVDSLLGATVQAIYFCEYDHKETESAIHRCGRPARFVRGWRLLDNDGVNFLSSIAGSALAAAGYLLLTRTLQSL